MSDPTFVRLSLDQTLIGHLRYLDGKTTFLPDHEWASDPRRPILGQRFEDDPHRRFGTSGRLPPWFSNLLPEGPFRRFVARGNDVSENSEFRLLAQLGADLPGALVAQPVDDLSQSPDEASEEDTINVPELDDPLFKFSLAGVQLKFSALHDEDRGFVVPISGVAGEWIVKLPDARYEGVPANEYSMMTWAAEVGVEVPEVRLISLDEIDGLPVEVLRLRREENVAYAIRRFDRENNGRQHMEDFAQVAGLFPEQKYGHAGYASLVRLVDAIVGPAGVREMLRRLVLLVAMDNGDAHLKNWTLRYPQPRSVSLSPAYDFVCTGAYIDRDPLALTLAGERDVAEISRGTFARLLRKAGVSEDLMEIVDQTVELARSTWQELRADLPCARHVKEHVDAQFERSPLLRGE